MCIADNDFLTQATCIFVRDIQSTNESRYTIDNKKFFVQTQIQKLHFPRQYRMHKHCNWNALLAKQAISGGQKYATPKSINQHANENSSLVRFCQSINKRVANFIRTEYVGSKTHACFGIMDCSEHLRISIISIMHWQ